MSYPYGQPPHQPPFPTPAPGHPGPAYAPPPNVYGPAYAAPPNVYGYPQPAPGGGTGIAAGVLALLGVLACVILPLPYIFVAPVLLVGGIMLLKRSKIGRIVVMVACVAFVVLSIVFGLGVVPVIGDLFAVLTLVLAALGSTTRWIETPQAPTAFGGRPPAPYGY